MEPIALIPVGDGNSLSSFLFPRPFLFFVSWPDAHAMLIPRSIAC